MRGNQSIQAIGRYESNSARTVQRCTKLKIIFSIGFLMLNSVLIYQSLQPVIFIAQYFILMTQFINASHCIYKLSNDISGYS